MLIATDNHISLAEIMDTHQLGTRRRIIIGLCIIIAVLDGLDVQVLAFVAPVISSEWGLSKSAMAIAFSLGLVGLMFGTITLGILGDRLGRRPVLLGSTVGFALAALGTATATDIEGLVVWRFITGLGLGGSIVNALSITSEYAPRSKRAFLVTLMSVGFPIGGMLGGLISVPLIQLGGWQAVFIVGGLLPLFFAGVAFFLLDETPSFIARKASNDDRLKTLLSTLFPTGFEFDKLRITASNLAQTTSSPLELFKSGRGLGTSLLWLTCFFNLLILYILLMWLPTLLAQSGLSLEQSIAGAICFNVGGVIGALGLGALCDRMRPANVIIAAYGLAAAAILGFAFANSLPARLTMITLVGAFIIGSQFSLNAVMANFYPTSIRSTGIGSALGFGRIGALIGPLVGAVALALDNLDAVTATLAIPAVGCSMLLGAFSIFYRQQDLAR